MTPIQHFAEAATTARTVPGSLAATLPDGEVVILAIKPSTLFIPLAIAGRLVVVAVLIAGIVWLALRGVQWPWMSGVVVGTEPMRVLLGGFAVLLAMLIWQRLEWNARRYLLTDRRVAVECGVIRKLSVEVPLAKVQHIVLYRSLRERLFGLGTIGVSSAGSDATEVVWFMVARPQEVMETIRKTLDRYGPRDRASVDEQEGRASARECGHAAADSARSESARACERSIPLIGLAGGIGAGKSTVAAAFRELGCRVIDSDAEAKAALDRPELRSQLVSWWGEDILAAGGEGSAAGGERRIDRSKVAAIVFADPEQRRRLEALVHPVLRRDRDAMLRELDSDPARKGGVRAVVLDAPLLFEAGLDRECDAIVFVDVPREHRLARLHASRGWTEEELARREASQLPLDEKRKRSHFSLTNTGSMADLKIQAATALADALQRCGRAG